MSDFITYDPSASQNLIDDAAWSELTSKLDAARSESLADVELLHSGGNIPADKQPLDSGFIDLPKRLLAGEAGLLDSIEASAKRFAHNADRMVLLGIGGSYMGLRALFEALCDPYHNELPRAARGGAPKLYFEGMNLDNDTVSSLLHVLKSQCSNPEELADRWGIVVISKSGGTLETAVSFRVFRDALEAYYGTGSDWSTKLVVPITGESGKLHDVSSAKGYPDVFPIPDGVGGRFSVFTAVGLYPAAVLGMDVRAMLQGAQDMTEKFATAPVGENPVLDYVGVCHLLEENHGMDLRVLSTWGNRMEAVGLWYDQLLAESLGKHERGATPYTVVNTRDLHSRGQQHQEGKRDRLITNVIVQNAATDPVAMPAVDESFNQDQLNRFAGKTYPEFLSAAIEGTNKAYADDNRPTANINLPELNAYHIGALLQMLMLATVVEGRLININPYGQPGVEAYKKNMGDVLSR